MADSYSLIRLKARFWKWKEPRAFWTVKTLAEADALLFLCPVCFEKNGGPVGTHSVRVDFAGRGVPDSDVMRNKAGQPVRWSIVSGSGMADLTLAPSIKIEGICGWHGFVRDGRATLKP